MKYKDYGLKIFLMYDNYKMYKTLPIGVFEDLKKCHEAINQWFKKNYFLNNNYLNYKHIQFFRVQIIGYMKLDFDYYDELYNEIIFDTYIRAEVLETLKNSEVIQ